MPLMTHPRAIALLAAALAAGCLEPPAPPAAHASVAQPAGNDPDECPALGCGSNSSVIDGLGFHDLSLAGLPNAQGLVYTGATHPELGAVNVYVTDGQLGVQRGASVLQGAAVVGLELAIHDTDRQRDYALRVVSAAPVPFWHVQPGLAWTYEIKWRAARSQRLTPLCANPTYVVPPMMDTHRVVVFEGDRIDAERKEVTSDHQRSWINIACGGTAPAKLFLTRFTWASRPGVPTPLAQRTALLKLFTADYCGHGRSYTFAGEPLLWNLPGALAWYQTPAPDALEARWGPGGAICLEAPRLLETTNQDARDMYPDIAATIAAECEIPVCGTTSPTAVPGLTSANY